MLLAVPLLTGIRWSSQLWSNAAWLLSRRDNENQQLAASYFKKAIQLNPANQRAYHGAGMLFAKTGDEEGALEMWESGNIDPVLLTSLGQHIQWQGDLDAAFIYFRSAALLAPSEATDGELLAGKLCQRMLADLTTLSLRNQTYCQDYIVGNDGNLLLNGELEQDIYWGWSGRSAFEGSQASVDRDYTVAISPPSLLLTGLTMGPPRGLYQRISLQPGTKIRFSGYFRAENVEEKAARLLYVEWRQNGKTHGTHLYTVDFNLDWQYFEMTFLLPDQSEPWVQFYPVILTGQASIWSDQMRVEILGE
jgi:tetratricopeptide (TPR) repeat protein